MERTVRIYITGASCAGVTTLGQSLAASLGVPHVDVDDFYWLPTNPPFTTKRPPNERVCLIKRTLGDQGWVLTGSADGWGEALISHASLIVFVTTPTPVRLQRLDLREKARFGERIAQGGDMHEIHIAFREWASQYDDPLFSGRNRARHEAWISRQVVPVLPINGESAAEHMVADVLHAVSQIAQEPVI